jgi:xanthine dehydrogenase accessory factor
MQSYYQVLQDYLDQGVPCVSITQVHTLGSAPQNIGAKMIVGTQDRLWGTIGGGKIENHCIAHAQQLLRQHQSHDYQVWNLQTDIGMTCGGVSHFFFEAHHSQPWTVAVFGAGHVAQALIPILCTLPCQVLCFDSRADWIDRLPRHPRLTTNLSATLSEDAKNLPHHAFVLSITMGHAHDVPVLDALLHIQSEDPEAFPYMGVIGSAAKAGAIRRDLKKRGHSAEALASLICPVGLPLGSNLPAEIAISISAQLLQYRDRIVPPK